MHGFLLLAALALPLSAAEWKEVVFSQPQQGVSLTFDAWVPDSPSPVPAVILVHGGGWEAGGKRTYIRPWFDLLTQARIAWFTIEYRLSGQAKHPAAVEDIEAAVRFIQANAARYKIDPARLGIMGESAGGHLAALVAVRGRVELKTAISFYGIHDIPLWTKQRGGLPDNIARYLAGADLSAASPITLASGRTPPMLLVHGTGDNGVPPAQSTVFCDRLKEVKATCEVFLLKDAPHGVENWEGTPAFGAWKPRVVQWLKARL